MIADPHNFLLEIWATAGSLALIGWLGLLGVFVWRVRGDLFSAAAPAAAPRETAHATNAVAEPRVAPVYLGALLGLVAGFIAAVLVNLAPDVVALAIGVPFSVAVVVALHGWVRRGVAPVWLAVLGIVVLFVILLAAGGIGFPGVGQTFWILLALALHRADEASPPRAVSRGAWWGIVGLTVGLWGACWLTAYGPVLKGQVSRNMAELHSARHNSAAAERAYLDWALNDPWSAEPQRAIADMQHRLWLETERPEHFRDFEHALAKALTLNLQSHRLRTGAGERYLQAYRVSNSTEHLEQAVAAFTEAVRIYPNSNIGHAQLAWALHVAGRDEAAEREAAIALELDAANPHREQKLKEQSLFDVAPAARFQEQVPPATRDDKAEPLMLRLRNTSQPSEQGGQKQGN